MLIKTAIAFAVCLLILAGLLILGYANMEKLLFPSPKGNANGNLKLKSGDALLDAFFAEGTPGKEVILYSHGNGETLETMRSFSEELARCGYSCLAYDYAGYGASTGKAGEKQAYSDIEAAYRFLTEEKKIPPSQIVVMGYSVGGGPSCYLAEKYPVRALVLLGTFASATKVYFPAGLPFDRFKNAERIRRINIPLMLVHGTGDRVVPYRNSQQIARNSASALTVFYTLPGGSHGDAVRFISQNPSLLTKFLESKLETAVGL